MLLLQIFLLTTKFFSIQSAKFKAEKAEADDARREQRREQRRDATISGGGASGGEQKSPEDMTEEELLAEMDRQGMVNQNDRPRAGR